MNKPARLAAMLLLACAAASTALFGGGAAIAISVSEGDNLVWVSLVRRIGVDYLVVSYEDRLNGTGKHFLNVRAQANGGPCGMASGQSLALITDGLTTSHLPATLVFGNAFGQHECRVMSIIPADQ
jgi:hypothetical protein